MSFGNYKDDNNVDTRNWLRYAELLHDSSPQTWLCSGIDKQCNKTYHRILRFSHQVPHLFDLQSLVVYINLGDDFFSDAFSVHFVLGQLCRSHYKRSLQISHV